MNPLKISLFCISLLLTSNTYSVSSAGDTISLSEMFESNNKGYSEALKSVINDKIPGAILMVSSPQYHFIEVAGIANIEKNTAMNSKFIFPVGSAGKPLIGTLSAILANEGKLKLDAILISILSKQLISQFPNGDKITFRQALNHTAGLYNYADDQNFFYDSFAHPSILRGNQYALSYAVDKPATTLPGVQYSYSNTGYFLVGLALNAILKKHHASELHLKVLTPLNLTNSYYNGIETTDKTIAPGYLFMDEDSPAGSS